MPGYVSEALARFKHVCTKKREDQPYVHVVPNYDVKVQYAVDEDTSRLATKEEDLRVAPHLFHPSRG